MNYAYKVKEYKLTPTDGTTQGTTADKTTASTSSKNGTTQSNSGSTQNGSSETKTTEKSTETATDSKDNSNTVNKETANKLIISAPIGASVYFDGEYIGIAPISIKKVTGSHIITFSQTGYLSKSYSVTLTDDGKDTRLSYDALTSIASLID